MAASEIGRTRTTAARRHGRQTHSGAWVLPLGAELFDERCECAVHFAKHSRQDCRRERCCVECALWRYPSWDRLHTLGVREDGVGDGRGLRQRRRVYAEGDVPRRLPMAPFGKHPPDREWLAAIRCVDAQRRSA